MVFNRPQRPVPAGQPQPIPVANGPQRRLPDVNNPPPRGNGGNGGGNGGNGGAGEHPSPWLEHPLDPNPNPAASASFVEYLRWMRSPDSTYKDPTKVQILQMATENANYRDRLLQLTERTKLIAGAGNFFQVKSSWRIRVGGHRGPESILLPAFDALGIPYIPSSTLRGAARTQAIRGLMAEGWSWEEAEKEIARYFGSLERKDEHRMGKVIFLDAYPLPTTTNSAAGLAVDMANSIWNWDGEDLSYAPNPNPFLSLKETIFMVGLRRPERCSEQDFQKIQNWLVLGLQAGIGSQINTGYGNLARAGQQVESNAFFQVEFSLEGQLVHGRQAFTQWKWNDRRNEWQMRGKAEAEVRPTAFKSMLRYWFRGFARGVLPADEVIQLEANIFGAIKPQERGWVTVEILDGKVVRPEAQSKRASFGEQAGKLCLKHSTEAPIEKQADIKALMTSLTWMLFHLGGIGQGARRPCYSRQSRDWAPWWRGASLIPDSEADFWDLPDTVQDFQVLFRRRLKAFYTALTALSSSPIDPQTPRSIGQISADQWVEVIDRHCKIVVCSGSSKNAKPYALSVLHDPTFKKNNDYDGNLCGKVGREVKPSPVWIANLGDYQVVTVFGATQDPRRSYLKALQDHADLQNFAQIFPLS
jgi:CRISPR-associated protein Cmr6